MPLDTSAPLRRVRATHSKLSRVVALTLAVLMGAVLVPTLQSEAARAEDTTVTTITDGELSWGFRQSFREYVGVDHIHTAGGASLDETGIVTFPISSGTYDPTATATELSLGGIVRYATYCGFFEGWPEDKCALDITLEQLTLTISKDEQVLSAHVHSRPLGAGSDTITDYGVIPIANLDVAAATAAVDGETTIWQGITASLANEFSPATRYPTGAPLDPVSFHYTGQGGKPDLSEQWTAPGTIAATEAERWVLDGDVYGLHLDEDRGVLHVVRPPNPAAGAFLEALDATTLEPLGTSATIPANTTGTLAGAFDPVSGTLFTVLTNSYFDWDTFTTVTKIDVTAFSWDARTGSYSQSFVGTIPSTATVQSNLVWDPASSSLFALTFTPGDSASTVRAWTESGSGWDARTIALPAQPGASASGFYKPEDRNGSIALAGENLLAVSRETVGSSPAGQLLNNPSALLLDVSADLAIVSTISGTGTDEWVPSDTPLTAWSRVTAGPDGLLAFQRHSREPVAGVLYAQVEGRSAAAVGDPIEFDTPEDIAVSGAFDPDGTFWVKAQNAGLLYPIVDGHALPAISHPDSFRGDALVIGSDHALYSAIRNPSRVAGVAKLERLGVSPTIIEQPADVTTPLSDSATMATFRAAATADPAPAVQWQAKDPGSVTFTNLSGQDNATLTVNTTGEMNGTQYRAVFTNPAGSIATDAVTLSVLTPPSVVVQPTSVSVGAGGTAQLLVMPSGNPEPTIAWQRFSEGAWIDITAGEQYAADGGYLTIAHVRTDQDGTRFRAQLTNDVGTVYSDEAVLTVTDDAVVPVPQEDGSIVGVKNAAGAHTQIAPGVDVPLVENGAALTVSGFGFTKNTNEAGVYALFGYMVTPPSAGGSSGNGYDFLPGGGDTGQLGQLFIAWPGNEETGGSANDTFSSTTDGQFTADGLVARAEFTGQSGATVNCLDGTVICGVLTMGAHGAADADLETFTPIYFTGQQIPNGPVTPPTPPTNPPTQPEPPAQATEEGTLIWGVKASFRNYIVSPTAKGSISLSGGASTSGGAFQFGQSGQSWDATTGTGSADYRGAVRFTGHSGILDLTLANPSVQIDSASSATLFVSVNGSRIAIGTMNLAAASRRDVTGGVAYSGAPVSLTSGGANVFSYGSSQFYAPGTAMDAVSFTIGGDSTSSGGGGTIAAFQESTWTPPAEPPATDGIEGDPNELANLYAGSELTVWADGFEPNETDIKVVIYSDPIVLEQHLTADANGRATWTGLIPAELEPGEHTLTFQGSVNRGIVLSIAEARTIQGCTVHDATLAWGFKESFRSYISGTIANGEWAASAGASYETAEFGWTVGEGVYDPETHTGLVTFTGAIRFTGHDGLLDTTISNPQLRFIDANTAYLLLDIAGVTMEDAMAGNTGDPVVETAVPFVKLDLAGGDLQVAADGTITATGVPAAITSEGFVAFPNYEAGTAFDPVSFTIPPTDCADPASASAAEDGNPATEQASSGEPDLSWLIWLAIAVLILAAIITIILLARRRRAREIER